LAIGAILLACHRPSVAADSPPGQAVGRAPRASAAELQRSFIWLPSAPVGQQVYAAFRRQFELSRLPESATLQLFADSRYQLWVNGRYVDRGPGRFDPVAPEYDTLALRPYLQPGTNVIAVLVHHYHDGQSSTNYDSINGRIMRHAPGLTARLELRYSNRAATVLRTDDAWRGTTRTRFLPSPTDRWENTWASIPDHIDARLDSGDWTQPAFDDSSWEIPVPLPGNLWGALEPRGIPLLRETQISPLTLLEVSGQDGNSGSLPGESRSLSESLPLAMKAGDRLVVDAGQFVQAYSVLDLEAEPGSELELESAPHYLESGRRLSGSYGRVNRYIARAGRQSYMSGDTFGFKYLGVRLITGRVRITGLRVVNRVYPFDVAGSFRCNDPLLTQLWSNCVHTVRICSEDAYVDCATRERTEWMADGFAVAYRTTRVAFAGPSVGGQPFYSDPRLLRHLLGHIGQSCQPDGRLKAHHPSDRWDIHGYIEDYSCLWVQALREYYDHSGDLEPARGYWPALTAQLQWFLDRRTTNGLVKAREFVYFGNPLLYQNCEGATLNAFVYGALRDAEYLAGQLAKSSLARQYREAAEALRRAVNERLWNETAGAYFGSLTATNPSPPTAHAALFCLQYGLASGDRERRARQWLLEHYRQESFAFPYTYQYLFEQLYRDDTARRDQEVLDLMRNRWGAMTRGETRTVWEAIGRSENAHEAGAVPAYFLSAYVLGVRLEGPASARQLLIQPRLGDLPTAEGTVVTELGPVPVQWRRPGPEAPLEFELTLPPHCRARLAWPTAARPPSAMIDGHEVSGSRIKVQGRYAQVELSPGRHRGRLKGVSQ